MKNAEYYINKNNKTVFFNLNSHYFLYNLKMGVFAKVEEPIYFLLKEWDGKSKAVISKAMHDGNIMIDVEKLLNQLNFLYASEEEKKSDFNLKENKPGNFWLLVTDACNLRCSYCYHNEDSKKMFNSNMSYETAKKAVDVFFPKYADKTTIVNFFGGEPLLNFPLIKQIVPYILEKSNQYDIKTSFSISTNAVCITSEIAEFLKQYDFFVTVSIDGGEEQHNKTRFFSNGEGSFEMVRNGVQLLKEQFDYLGARVTVTKENYSSLSDSFDQLFAMGFDAIAYKLVGACPEKLIVASDDLPIFESEIEKIADNFRNRLLDGDLKVSDRHLQWLKKIYKKPKRSECSFAMNGKLVVDPMGNFFSCQETVGNSKFKIGDVNSGIDLNKLVNCSPPPLKNRGICKDCWINDICDGMCYYSAYVKYGSFDKPIEESCAEIKDSFLDSLFLYGELYMNNPEYLNKILKSSFRDVREVEKCYNKIKNIRKAETQRLS